MSTTEKGRSAEDRVARHMSKQGWKVLDRNWRNRWCEIDVITRKGSLVAFVEVKYRVTEKQGDGFEAITASKLDRMSRAAEAWVQKNNWSGEYELLVAAVSNESIEVREIY